jgi:TnpA family transposase
MNIMRTLQVEERPSRLALAIAEVGRIDKTIDTLSNSTSPKAATALHGMSFMANV